MGLFDDELRADLHAAADVTAAGEAAWSAVQSKIAAGGTSQPPPPVDVPRRVWRWRGPLLAAAVVAAVATVTVVGLRPDDGTGLAGTADKSQTTAAAPLPTTAPPQPTSSTPTSSSALVEVGPIRVPVAGVWSTVTPQQFTMELMGGPLRVSSDDNYDYLGDDSFGDGSPLGLVRAAPARPIGWSALDPDKGYSYGVITPPSNEGGSYLYGVVGTDIDAIAILTADSGTPGDRGVAGDLVWTVGPADAQSTWTSLTEGYRAFAVQAPAPSATITALALDSQGRLLQARQWTSDGQVTDLPATAVPSLDDLKIQTEAAEDQRLTRAWDHLTAAPDTCPDTLDRPSSSITAWTVVDQCRVVLLTNHTLYLTSPAGVEILSAGLDLDDLTSVAVTGDTVWIGTRTSAESSDSGRLAVLVVGRDETHEILLPRRATSMTPIIPFDGGVITAISDIDGAGTLIAVAHDGTTRTIDRLDTAPYRLATDGQRIVVATALPQSDTTAPRQPDPASPPQTIAARDTDGTWHNLELSGDINITDLAISGDLLVASVNLHGPAHVPETVFTEVSRDGGRTWDRTNLNDRNYIHSIDIAANGTLVAAMDGDDGTGVLAAPDQRTWTPIDGMPQGHLDVPVETAGTDGIIWTLADTITRYTAP